MRSNMTKPEIKEASVLKLFAHVFGKREGQDLKGFAEECRPLRDDEKFIAEVRDYAMAEAAV